ncbi:hypothetical protein SLE2022_265150 [Rubroshorea leprosula]
MITEIELPKEWEIDISEKPLLIEEREKSRLIAYESGKLLVKTKLEPSHKNSIDLGALCYPKKDKEVLTKMTSIKHEVVLDTLKIPSRHFKIKGDYYDGKEWHNISILIDIGAGGTHIHSNMIPHLQRFELTKPYTYYNFNDTMATVHEYAKVPLRIEDKDKIQHEITITTHAKTEMSASIELMLGNTFLTSV